MPNQPSDQPDPKSAANLGPQAESTCGDTADSAAAELVSILDQYLADLKGGHAPSRQELMTRHPALASQLEACLAGLEFIHGAESAAPGKAQRLGDFRIIREVGRGGMGAVFEAEQISLGRSVALKILRFGAVSDPESIERFKREAETVAKLHHTNIVPIFNVGNEHGVNYYAMQFIEGPSLAEVLAEKQQPLPASQVAEWGLQAAEALAHAHQRGVIHRDVKPSNLLLDKENRLWLTDFGLARRMEDVTLSITGAILGTPRYMSPEQADAAHKRVDHRSDLFSLGATLYELLTGKPAFSGNTPHDVIQSILNAEPVPVRQLVTSVPRDLETILMKCLAKEPGQRYNAASDLAADLRDFLDGRPIQARRAGWAERTVRWVKRQQQSVKLAATAAALTLTVTSGATGKVLWRSQVSESGRKYQVRAAALQPGKDADLDGDGIADLLGWNYVSHYRRRDNPFFAISGRTGRKLWIASDISIQILQGVLGAESYDLDRDGKPEVLWMAALDYGYTLRTNVSTHESQLWLFVTSGQTGKLRWSHPLSTTFGQTPGRVMQIDVVSAALSPTVGDINGDGTNDILIPELLPDGQSLQTVALDGKDGTVLWFRSCSTGLNQRVSFSNWEPPAVCDLNGDGQPEVLVVEVTNSGGSDNPVQPRYRVVLVRGHDGGTIWDWICESASVHWQPQGDKSKGELMRPRPLRSAGKESRVVLLLPGQDGAIVVVGGDGVEHTRKVNAQTSTSGIWVCDADGDGVDELVFFAEDCLCVASADRLDQPLWSQPLGSQGQHQMLGIVSRGEQLSPVLAIARDASDNSVLGYDAATGRRIWSCPGVIFRGNGVYFVPRLSAGMAFFPVIVAIGLMGVWLSQRQWRRIILWFGVTWVTSGISGLVLLWTAAPQNPEFSEVHYDLTGWYLIGFIGAYLTSWLLVIVVPSKQLLIRGLNRFRNLHRSLPSKEPDATMATEITSSQ